MNYGYGDEEHAEHALNAAEDRIIENLLDDDGIIKATTDVHINGKTLSNFISTDIKYKLEKEVLRKIDLHIKQEVHKLISTTYCDDISPYLKNEVTRILESKFSETYKEEVDKANDKILKTIQSYSPSTVRGNYVVGNQTIVEKIDKMFTDYLDKEFKEVVTKTKDNLDNFAQNYFSKNLFRAMGLMNGVTGEEGKELSKD